MSERGRTRQSALPPTSRTLRMPPRWLLWTLACLVPASALAVTTTAFELEDVKAFEKGKFEGTAVLTDGRVVRGVRTERVELSGVPVAYTSSVDEKGRIYVGTGNAGEIHRVVGDESKLFAKLDAAVVTALVAADDVLYAGAMPAGGVWRVAADGQVSKLAELAGVEHVWALAYDAKRKLLFAGTGPEGKVFRIDSAGNSTLLFDAEAEHVLSLALGGDGSLYAGTSDGALLYRLGEKSPQVVYDFPGEELTAISVRGGRIAVTVSKFPALPATPKKPSPKPPKLKPGEGQVWLVHASGRAERLHEEEESHLSDVELAESGDVFVATGTSGRVLRVTPEGEHGVWVDVEGRQVLSLGLTDASPHVIVSDTAAVLRVTGQRESGNWTSEPLDAETRARWGELTPRFAGDVRWQTRSGNTEQPDATWSPWSRPSRGAGPVRSPAARYLQVRALLSGEGAELRSLSALYLAANRPARSRSVHIEPPKKKDDDDLVDGVFRVPAVRKLKWKTDNPDDDALSYRLHYQLEGARSWVPMQRADELLSEAEYEWDTRPLPDGLYRVRVTTSDAPSNPAAYALSTDTVSPLLRVDNHAPELRLQARGASLRGTARDGTSRIAALTLSVDAGPFWPIAPEDDLLDQRVERFAVPLSDLSPGTHTVAVRATDAAGNARVQQLSIEIGR